MKRNEHLFQFSASRIGSAAKAEAAYHRERVQYWLDEMDKAYQRVEATMSAKIDKQLHTGGYHYVVVLDAGDPAAYARMNEAARKVDVHREKAEQFESAALLFGTQADNRVYDLDVDDVHYYRLGGEKRDE